MDVSRSTTGRFWKASFGFCELERLGKTCPRDTLETVSKPVVSVALNGMEVLSRYNFMVMQGWKPITPVSEKEDYPG